MKAPQDRLTFSNNMNKYAKLYFGEVHNKVAAGLGTALADGAEVAGRYALSHLPQTSKWVGAATKGFGGLASDVGHSIWNNSKGVINWGANAIANKIKPLTAAADSLVPDAAPAVATGAVKPAPFAASPEMGAGGAKPAPAPAAPAAAAAPAPSVASISPSAGRPLPKTPFLSTRASEWGVPASQHMPNAIMTPGELLEMPNSGLTTGTGINRASGANAAATKLKQLQESGSSLPEYVHPGSEREAAIAGRPFKPTLDPNARPAAPEVAAAPDPTAPKATAPEPQTGAKPMPNKGILGKGVSALPVAGIAGIAGATALSDGSIPNLAPNPATSQAGGTPGGSFGENPFSKPFNQGVTQPAAPAGDNGLSKLLADSQAQNDQARALLNKPRSSAPIESTRPTLAPQSQIAPPPQQNVRPNSQYGGVEGTASNAIGRAGDSMKHLFQGTLGQHQDYRNTSFLPGA